jgi:predicted RNA-binding Zn-ribbon protein involved in translation (DUF1610 family)
MASDPYTGSDETALPDVNECATCGVELETTAVDGEPPVRTVEQTCPECGRAIGQALVELDETRFLLYARPVAGTCDRCGDTAAVVTVDSRDRRPELTCWNHVDLDPGLDPDELGPVSDQE